MTMDQGTPKRRRGLFRRERTEEPNAEETGSASTGIFDDPWSASAWDDWDDDFTAGGQRSSVPAAAAPRPAAVEAWLQSEANDFDDAARKNTKRWGGDATRPSVSAAENRPGFGLAARGEIPLDGRIRNSDQPPVAEPGLIPADTVARLFDETRPETARETPPEMARETTPETTPTTTSDTTGAGLREDDLIDDSPMVESDSPMVESEPGESEPSDTASDDADATALGPDDDELVAADALEPDVDDLADLSLLDQEPTIIPTPVADWAPTVAPERPPFPLLEIDRSETVANPDTPSAAVPNGSASRFVSVSVVSDGDRGSLAPIGQASAPLTSSAPATAVPSVPSAQPTPSPSRSRWAQLAAEFDSDGDLDDSFPRLAEANPVIAPSAPTEPEPTAPPVAPASAAPVEVETTPLGNSPDRADVEERIDPWSRPPKLRAATDVAAHLAPPVDYAPSPRPARPARPDTRPAAVKDDLFAAATPPPPPAARRPRPQRPSPDRTPSVLSVDGGGSVHPEFSTFCGAVGSSLVVIAILRLVVTLVGDQPTLPTRFSGTKADLLRIGDSFARAGTAWPVALMVGTVLLVLPAYLGLQHHVRRWAPMLGLSLVTGLAAMLVGYLRIYSGRELKSASTLTLVSDALVGPIGLGALTIICIALAVQVTRRRQ